MAKVKGNFSWIVVSDPLQPGGFLPETKLSEEDVVNMLRFRTFTLGTILRHRIYGKFQVMNGTRPELAYKMKNSRYVASISTGQKIALQERPQRKRECVA